MQVKKPDFKIFAGGAEDGELHDFPDVTRGWGVTKLQTNKKPPLSWMNGAFNRVDNNFYYLLQNGLVEWNSEIEYSANALSQVDGVIYRAKEASKGESPAASAKWEKLFADKVGTSDFIGMSQNAVKKELDKKVSAADLTQTITEDKLKAPSNLAVNTALKEQDPRQWGFGNTFGVDNAKDYTELKYNAVYYLFSHVGDTFKKTHNTVLNLTAHESGNYRIQLAFTTATPTPYAGFRRRNSTGITEWYEIYTTANTSIDPNGVLTTKQDTVTLTTNDLAKETGNSHSKVMTQKAVSDLVVSHGLGYEQEWHDVKESREFGVTYTNDTNKPMLILLSLMTISGGSIIIRVNDVEVATLSASSSARTASEILIPSGHTYIVTTNNQANKIFNWSELK